MLSFAALPHSLSNRYANRCAWFINVYASDLDGPKAAWANHRYHRNCALPADMLLSANNWALEAHNKAGITSQTVTY